MVDPAFSRPMGVAAGLKTAAPRWDRFSDDAVLLTGETAVLRTYNGRACAEDCLRLLVRITKHVIVWFPPGAEELLSECRAVAARCAPDGTVAFPEETPALGSFGAVLSVGSKAMPELPWTVVNAHGWLARVSSGRMDLPADCSLDNPISPLAAASLGVADVFKRLIGLREEKGRLFSGLSFSLQTYETGDLDPGASLPPDLRLDAVVVGAGAIGNGVVHLLRRTPARGTVRIVDPQVYEEVNRGTCILIGPGDVGRAKALVVAGELETKYDVVTHVGSFATFADRLGPQGPYPRLVLSGVDSSESRRSVQDLWPDVVIDGAIGQLECQVSRHPWGGEVACLRCIYPETGGIAAEVVQQEATGLSLESLANQDRVLTERDVEMAREDARPWLRVSVGKRVCSLVQEGVVRMLSNRALPDHFTPSAPFVACLSASMMVAEAVKHAAGWPSRLSPRFQFHALRGPDAGQFFEERRRASCLCVERGHNIATWRGARSSLRG